MRVGKGEGRKHSLVFIEETLRTCLFFYFLRKGQFLGYGEGSAVMKLPGTLPSGFGTSVTKVYKSFQSLVFTFVVLTFHLLTFPTPVSALNLGRVTGK